MLVDHEISQLSTFTHDCDKIISKMRSMSSRIHIGCFLMKRECSKYTYKAYKISILLKIKLLHFSLRLKIEMENVLKKIEHVCESVSLDDQGHSPHPRGEDLLQ
jgi:hypothetical protein